MTNELLKRVFSITTQDKYIVICIFGIKIKVKRNSKSTDILIDKLTKNIIKEITPVISHQASRALSISNLHQKVFPKYRNIHQGKDIVIVGTGPTLNDYVPIEHAIHIGVNRAFKCDKINFDYLFTIDYINAKHYIEEMKQYKPETCKKFFGSFADNLMPLQIPDKEALDINAERYYLGYHDFDTDEQFPFDISTYPIASFWTVSFQALQFALWTNPKRIFIVGCDESDLGHFNGDKQVLNESYHSESKRQHTVKHMDGWNKLKQFVKIYYPDTEIISINPVGLKGMFKDYYLDEYKQYSEDKTKLEIK